MIQGTKDQEKPPEIENNSICPLKWGHFLYNTGMNKIEVNMELNPINCEEKGYKWTGDAIYDPEAPEEANEEFVELTKQGYILGEPANTNTVQNGGVGVYKPIEK